MLLTLRMNLQTGEEMDVGQTNCQPKEPCPDGDSSKCVCPLDLIGQPGVLINKYIAYQCSYTLGACDWDQVTSSYYRFEIDVLT